MTHNPPTRQLDLDAIEARAARLYERTATIDPNAHPDFGQLTDADVPALVDEVRRLRALADRTRALALLEAANFCRDAFLRDPWLSVQEISAALRNTADQADPMVGSLARDGFGHDEIADILARPAVRPAVETGA